MTGPLQTILLEQPREVNVISIERELAQLRTKFHNDKINCIKARDPPADITIIFYEPLKAPPVQERKDWVR